MLPEWNLGKGSRDSQCRQSARKIINIVAKKCFCVLLFTTSTSSKGSFHKNLYLLEVSITLAAVYLQEQKSALAAAQHQRAMWGQRVFFTHRLMELRLNEPDFLFRVVQMIRSLKRKRERSFFPPTVFYRNTQRAQRDVIHKVK